MLKFNDRDYNKKEIVVAKVVLYFAKAGVESLLSGFTARNTK